MWPSAQRGEPGARPLEAPGNSGEGARGGGCIASADHPRALLRPPAAAVTCRGALALSRGWCTGLQKYSNHQHATGLRRSTYNVIKVVGLSLLNSDLGHASRSFAAGSEAAIRVRAGDIASQPQTPPDHRVVGASRGATSTARAPPQRKDAALAAPPTPSRPRGSFCGSRLCAAGRPSPGAGTYFGKRRRSPRHVRRVPSGNDGRNLLGSCAALLPRFDMLEESQRARPP